MSTNFYVYGFEGTSDPDWHVGKRVGIADGKTEFIWAMEPVRFHDLKNWNQCPTCKNEDFRATFVDEYGAEYSWQRMFNLIYDECSSVRFTSIGERFC